MKIEELKEALGRIRDPRRIDRGHILHKLEDIIIIGLCTFVCNGSDFSDMEAFGKEREEWLRGFLELPNGIPDSDTFRRVFERLEPAALSESLYDWLASNRKEGCVVAVDGKTICGSRNHDHRAYHVVSAFVAENQITLGEVVTEEKSNEITAVPELLEALQIKNSVVTADAMSCQKGIVKTIRGKGADYVIGLKKNQPNLLEEISLYYDSFSQEIPVLTVREKGHGRIEKREYQLLTDLTWLNERENWAGLNAAGRVRTSVTRLDVIFKEDSSRARKDLSPLNLNVLRKVALALCKQCKNPKLSKSSLQKRRFRASLNPETFLSILLG